MATPLGKTLHSLLSYYVWLHSFEVQGFLIKLLRDGAFSKDKFALLLVVGFFSQNESLSSA
jgi:hypothetical protein